MIKAKSTPFEFKSKRSFFFFAKFDLLWKKCHLRKKITFLSFLRSKRALAYIYLMSISERSFCFWDAKSDGDTYAIMVHTIVAAVVLVISCYRLVKFRQLYQEFEDSHLRICSQLHLFTALWSLSIPFSLLQCFLSKIPTRFSSSSQR